MKKPVSYLLLLFCALSFFSVTQAQSQNSANSIFNQTERDSLQLWFYDRATVMGLDVEKRDEFYNIVLYHSFKMKALGKKDKGLSEEEIKQKFDKLLLKQHAEVKAILDEKQYTYYLDTYSKILKGVYMRKGWDQK